MDPAAVQPAAVQPPAVAQPAGAFSAVPPPPPAATVSPGADGGLPTAAEVAAMVSSTSVTKRKRAGTHVVSTAAAKGKDGAGKKPRAKSIAAGPGSKQGVKRKQVVQRPGLPPSGTSSPLPPVDGASDAQRVLDDMPPSYAGHSSFMDMLNDTEVSISETPLGAFGDEDNYDDAQVEDDDEVDDDVKEIKLAKVEAAREEAKLKAEMEAEKIKVKNAKALKALLDEEREIIMMPTENMTELQLEWWKDACAEIMERRRQRSGAGNGGSQVDHGDTSTA